MSDIQSEIIESIKEIQIKIEAGITLREKDFETLLLSALIEEEA